MYIILHGGRPNTVACITFLFNHAALTFLRHNKLDKVVKLLPSFLKKHFHICSFFYDYKENYILVDKDLAFTDYF